eukprot:767184-Hanusia_phi.AAC.1
MLASSDLRHLYTFAMKLSDKGVDDALQCSSWPSTLLACSWLGIPRREDEGDGNYGLSPESWPRGGGT